MLLKNEKPMSLVPNIQKSEGVYDSLTCSCNYRADDVECDTRSAVGHSRLSHPNFTSLLKRRWSLFCTSPTDQVKLFDDLSPGAKLLMQDAVKGGIASVA